METQSNSKKKIIIAEDERALSRVISNKLARYGYSVDVAANGQEVLDKMRENKPDLVLLDLVMPKKDGFTVLKEAKADELIKDVNIVVFSNLNQVEDKERVKKLGAMDFLVKSNISITDVIEKVKNYLEGN